MNRFVCHWLRQCFFVAAIPFAALLLAGCPREQPAAPAGDAIDASASPRASVALRVLVVNDPPLAEAINRLRGEWAERGGGTLSAAAKTWAEAAAAKAVDADVVVFPSRYLGEFCTRGWLRPVRQNVLESEAFDAADIFPLVRRELITWGGQVMALPLGIDLPTGWGAFDRPAAVSLLVQAAPHAVSNDRIGVLFDPETVQPRITELPFVRALKELTRKLADAQPVHHADVLRVPVLGVDDRLVAVTTESHNAATAFKLLSWLSGPEISSQLARAGDSAMPVRRSLSASPAWYDPKLSASERAELGKTLEKALSGQQCLVIPRIPGIDHYIAALDQAVKDAVGGKVEPDAALQQAADKWEKITDAYGRDSQRRAYLNHLGITER